MGRRGRPPKGPELVEHTEGSEAAKERLRIILETLAGTMSVAHACALLGVGEARFHEMRMAWLRQSVQLLEPKPKGRPPEPEPPPLQRDVDALKAENRELRAELLKAQLCERLARLMPKVLSPGGDPAEQDKKKT